MGFKINHVALSVNSINESVQWYKEKLGFHVFHEYKSNELQITHIKLGGVIIELVCFRENTSSLPDYRNEFINDLHTVGTKHLCIELDNLETTVQTLRTKGVDFVTKVDTAAIGGKYIFFKDCNGILIELYEKLA